ncbi:hypothetical protein FNU76_07870 [Chitinimonas arctica]|uniref:Uncharacterized protein n=1 Tax=Chitinimonas arctica TaxID=2594795 RepID=A0A516SDP8_9NEIS|nr:hypothetical protein [Chitinimonas arctica]QDQ26283.1 hypothetical protein FNU76_07870 [Chitinimonas arctica]
MMIPFFEQSLLQTSSMGRHYSAWLAETIAELFKDFVQKRRTKCLAANSARQGAGSPMQTAPMAL